MQFTEQQIDAITSQSSQTLVSAAAGSGKTRVLTQRIEALVRGADLEAFRNGDEAQVRPDKMADIRRMLVMTFTRSAAAEMRGRIVKALTDAAHAQEDRGEADAAHKLRLQAEAAAGADISTVHSFCNRVIADHYELAEVCAGFGILSADQSRQLMEDAAQEIFEERYEAEDQRIVRLLRKFASKGRDKELLNHVLRIYGQMMSTADGEEWLLRPLGNGWDETISKAWDKLRITELSDAAEALRRAADLTEKAGNEEQDKKILKKAAKDREWVSDIEAMLIMARAGNVDAAVEQLGTGTIRFANTAKAPGILATAQELRDDAKKSLALVRSIKSGPEARRMLKEAHEDLELLANLIKDFSERYEEKKHSINKLDYNDLEHKALMVLRKLGETGDGYDKYYRHVFVDEYQDTNQVQESILQELTGDDNSVFMVGDMKQSIYGFRYADPTSFKEKGTQFARGDGGRGRRIIMNHNFRSTPAVIDTVNAVMRCLMSESVGGVDYERQEELVLGRTDGEPGHAQILIAKTQNDAASETASAKDESEAEMIAARIAELVEAGTLFSDIAVLLRSRSDRVNALERALESRGIPYFAELDSNRTFTELDIFLNLLELIVNERRDVPLLSVLRSYMFGFNEADFARVVNWNTAHPELVREDDGKHKKRPFFYRLRRYRDAGHENGFEDPEDTKLLERIDVFFSELEKLRIMGTDMALGRFAEEVGARYEFGAYLLTRPAGASRKKAYDTLLETIAAQQEIHGNSLYRVLQAVRKVRATGAFEADSAAADVNAVRITTIHKSKGLEYPVVFVAAMDRQFNTSGTRGDVLTSDAYGVTLRNVDEQTHLRSDTMESVVVKRYIEESQRSEELRTLYVAMTRARDQLYLCGAADDEDKSKRRWRALSGRHSAAKSLLDWLMAAYFELRETDDVPESLYSGSFWEPGQRVGTDTPEEKQLETVDPLELVAQAQKEGRQDFYGLDQRRRQPAVQGVSKRIMAEKREENEGLRPPYAASRLLPILPESDDGTLSGAQRGTLLHRALRYGVQNRLKAEDAIKEMIRNRLVTDSDSAELYRNIHALDAFFNSPLYERVEASSKVLTEQPFELLVDVPVEGDYSDGRMRLRGMIDLAFIEDGQWVLVDYKSDRGVDGVQLADRYSQQVEYYREALEKLSGMKVKESYLFSLERKEAVPVGCTSSSR